MKTRSRFHLRKRILETLILLWLAAWVMGYFDGPTLAPEHKLSPTPQATANVEPLEPGSPSQP